MRKIHKTLILFGIVCIIASIVFPPYRVTEYYNHDSVNLNIEYNYIFKEIDLEMKIPEGKTVYDHCSTNTRSFLAYDILIFEWTTILLLNFGLFVLTIPKKNEA